jgi:hypothetical protein
VSGVLVVTLVTTAVTGRTLVTDVMAMIGVMRLGAEPVNVVGRVAVPRIGVRFGRICSVMVHNDRLLGLNYTPHGYLCKRWQESRR